MLLAITLPSHTQTTIFIKILLAIIVCYSVPVSLRSLLACSPSHFSPIVCTTTLTLATPLSYLLCYVFCAMFFVLCLHIYMFIFFTAYWTLHIHCESKKLCHFHFYCNFGKRWSIFKILSMLESERNGS